MKSNYNDILNAVKNFKINEKTLNHLYQVQFEFNRYLSELLKAGNEFAVHYLMTELYNELVFSNDIEGVKLLPPASIINNGLVDFCQYISKEDIYIIQKLLFQNQDTKITFGYRTNPVYIPTINEFNQPVSYIAPEPESVPYLMRDFINFFNHNSDSFKDNDPFVKSALLHVLFVTIHPFIDGNGRTARMLHNLKFTDLVNRTYSDRNHRLDLQVCPLNISFNLCMNRYSYCQKLSAIQLGKKEDLMDALNSWVNFILYMYEEQLNQIENSNKITETLTVLSDEDMKRLLSSVFTDIHYGRAISIQEWERDRKWEEENNDVISQTRKIIEADPTFEDLPYEAKIRFTSNILAQLKKGTIEKPKTFTNQKLK